MPTLTIELPDDVFERLQEEARRRGVTSEELARAIIVAALEEAERPGVPYEQALEYLLWKNRDLRAPGVTRFLTVEEALRAHARVVELTGGTEGLRDPGGLEAAVAQPQMTFGGEELYPTLAEKAAAVAFSLAKNHPFIDGNKRIAHAAMELFLLLNGWELNADVDEQERVWMALAAGEVERDTLTEWVRGHLCLRR